MIFKTLGNGLELFLPFPRFLFGARLNMETVAQCQERFLQILFGSRRSQSENRDSQFFDSIYRRGFVGLTSAMTNVG